MDTSEDREWAANQLAHAENMSSQIRHASTRRVQVYLIAWALLSVGLVLCIGLLDRVGIALAMAVWAVVVVAGIVWSRRWGSVAHGSHAQIRRGATGWAVVYAVVVATGSGGKIEDAWFWAVGAAATAIPLLMAARQCKRCNNLSSALENGTAR